MPSLNELLHEIKRIEKSREVLTEEKIRAIYRSLIDDLEQYLSKTYKQYADDEGRLYVHYLDSKNKRAKFLQEIAANVDTLSVPLKAHITKLVNSTYEETYKGMINAFKQAEDIAQFAKLTKDIDVNPRVLKQAINNNISKLTLPPVLEKHRNELVYQMQQELNIGLMNGDRYETMAKRISERCNVSYNKAMNITRTETHRNVESGFMDGAEYIQENLDGSGMIYAAIWRTMKDERVRPWKRVKTKHGWKIIKKETGANHRKMEGVTVKAGELFDLGGVKAKAPSQSGVAAHDCRCRCFLEYKMMTAEEFAKATGQTEETIRRKYGIGVATAKINEKAAEIDFSLESLENAKDREMIEDTIQELAGAYPTKKRIAVTCEKIANGDVLALANYEGIRVNGRAWNDGLEIHWSKSQAETDLSFYTKVAREATYKPTVQKAEKMVKKLREEVKYNRFATYHTGVNVVDKATLIRHEYGHVIADQYIGQLSGAYANLALVAQKGNKFFDLAEDIKRAFKKAKKSGDIYDISLYASTNEREFFAEAFVMYDKGERLPDYIYEIIERVLKIETM